MIDQRLLPETLEIIEIDSLEGMVEAIVDMAVRGAPAIGIAAAWGMVIAMEEGIEPESAAEKLRSSRPTAKDLFTAVDRMLGAIERGEDPRKAARRYHDEIVERCRLIGVHGAPLIRKRARVLTHCNAGALATGDWGTALAPMRVAKLEGRRFSVLVDETRPRLQGARLTSWELHNEDIDHAVIADNAAGHFMARGMVDLVITGADRVVANGDAANKIGTYEKAVLAHANGIPFFIAVPASTYDDSLSRGDLIPIEERSAVEVHMVGSERVTPEGVRAMNPAFDVTPARYITGYITEFGVLGKDDLPRLKDNVFPV